MSAVDAIRMATDAGVNIRVRDGRLSLEADTPPPDLVLRSLRENKAEIIAHLSGSDADWSPEDWQAFFDERAGIAEHDGGLPRADAEAQAMECCVVAWMNAHPIKSDSDRCAHCGRPEAGGAQVIPFGDGPVWLHAGCWREWQNKRKREAVEYLKTSGIPLKADVGEGV